jgi:hypothetical protein
MPKIKPARLSRVLKAVKAVLHSRRPRLPRVAKAKRVVLHARRSLRRTPHVEGLGKRRPHRRHRAHHRRH